MDPRDFAAFLRRRLVAFFIVMVVMVGLSVGYTMQYDKGKEGVLVFLTIGMEVSGTASSDIYGSSGDINVIDQFTETVMGWFLNPAFLERVNDQTEEAAGYTVELSIRKQEKQNLLVTVVVPSGSKMSWASSAVLMALDEEITAYNEATHAGFVVALSSVSEFEEGPNYALNAVVFGLMGLVLAVVTVLLYEYGKRRVSFAFQVEQILGVPPLARISGEKMLKSVEVSDGVLIVKLGETSEDYLRELARQVPGAVEYILIV